MANILVVDDDEIILKTVKASLVKDGHTVTTAKEGHSAIHEIGREGLHMVITDVNMPHGINGFTLVKMIRDDEKTAKIPIMIISSRRSESDVLRGIEAGVDDYLIKPLDFDIFVAKVKTLLTRGEHSFTPSRIQVQGTITLPIVTDIVGISEEGIQLLSTVILEVNSKVVLDSPLYTEIGINTPNLRIAHCEKLETGSHPFAIKANFIGLTPSDQQKVRVYASKARVKTKS